jgi:murein DD-endopeptidase MepM/ murein hydrolase activator NlpD
MRIIAVAVAAVLVVAAGVTFWVASRAPAPTILINQPAKVVGQEATLDVTLESPGSAFKTVEITLEQKGRTIPLFSLATPAAAALKQETPDRVRITRPIGRRDLPALESGPARLVVTASRSVLRGLRTPQATLTRDFQVQLTPPRIGVLSTHHYINHGGSEMVVYRVTPPEVESGVQVGAVFYRGFPASGAGVATSDPAVKVAFFALLYDQDLNAPISLVARDEAGNMAHASFDFRVFEKPQKRSRIEVDDAFLQRVVPDIFQHSPEVKASPNNDLVADYLTANRDLRRINGEKIISLAKQSAPQVLWSGPFRPLGNAAIESKFADHRTYFYQGREIDQQVHLGFDLAVTTNIPVLAGNDGKVVHADYLGIYGNCVIIDHGMGLQSLYGHLSSIDVRVGDVVKKDQPIGRSGMTGLAAGDHLHFGVYLEGQAVNPVEWWDPHWIEDRVTRKIREAVGGSAATSMAPAPAPARPAAKKPRKPARRAPRRGLQARTGMLLMGMGS